MTDDLVKRLREDQPVTQDMVSTMQCALQDDAADRIEALTDQLEAARDDTKKAVEAAVDAGASLAAAISLLERGGRKAAPSNKMFDQMLVDYRNSLERTRTALAEIEGEKT
jgi:predicted phage gp36 major capsid-like protein